MSQRLRKSIREKLRPSIFTVMKGDKVSYQVVCNYGRAYQLDCFEVDLYDLQL